MFMKLFVYSFPFCATLAAKLISIIILIKVVLCTCLIVINFLAISNYSQPPYVLHILRAFPKT